MMGHRPITAVEAEPGCRCLRGLAVPSAALTALPARTGGVCVLHAYSNALRDIAVGVGDQVSKLAPQPGYVIVIGSNVLPPLPPSTWRIHAVVTRGHRGASYPGVIESSPSVDYITR